MTYKTTAERIAQEFHETYEQLAPKYGYKTCTDSAVPWAEVPQKNKALMVATVQRLLDNKAIHADELKSDDDIEQRLQRLESEVEEIKFHLVL